MIRRWIKYNRGLGGRLGEAGGGGLNRERRLGGGLSRGGLRGGLSEGED